MNKTTLVLEKSIGSCQHIHTYKNTTVGQINPSRENKIPFQFSQLYWAGKRETLFFQDEGKTRPLLVYPVELVSKEGQFNAFIKEKKISSVVYQGTLGSFQAENPTWVLCVFHSDPRRTWQDLSPWCSRDGHRQCRSRKDRRCKAQPWSIPRSWSTSLAYPFMHPSEEDETNKLRPHFPPSFSPYVLSFEVRGHPLGKWEDA